MEHDLLMVLFSSSIITALTSFILSERIMLKMFAGTLLACTSFSLYQAQAFIGAGSINPVIYTGFDATDAGAAGVVPLALGLGLWASIYFIDGVRLYLKMTDENRQRFKAKAKVGTFEQMRQYM